MQTSPAAYNVLPVELIGRIAHSTESIVGSVDRAQQDNCTAIECPIGIETLDELCVACNWLTMAMSAAPKTVRAEENAIAARILELRDRVGGFIRPSLQSLFDKNT